MQIVVIGGAGVLGQALLREIAERGELTRAGGERVPVRRVISVDRHQPPRLFVDDRVEYVREAPGTQRLLGAVMGTATDTLFHVWDGATPAQSASESLAATLALVDSVREVLVHCAAQLSVPRVVFASGYAARPGAGGEPSGSEGRRLRVAELLFADAARAGRVDGRSVRLAPVAGAPGGAAFAGPLLSALCSGAREPCPVPVDLAWCLTSAAAAAAALLDAHEAEAPADGAAPLWAPSRSVSIGALLQAAAARLGRPVAPPSELLEESVAGALVAAPCAPPGEVREPGEALFQPPPTLEALLRQLIGPPSEAPAP